MDMIKKKRLNVPKKHSQKIKHVQFLLYKSIVNKRSLLIVYCISIKLYNFYMLCFKRTNDPPPRHTYPPKKLPK